eukprot:SAG22_NODE_19572_length_273_cov_1.195402_1_plen_36_part_10
MALCRPWLDTTFKYTKLVLNASAVGPCEVVGAIATV